MMEPEQTLLTRSAVIDAIARSSLSGNLGLFVVTGFSIAATDGDAPTFLELLTKLVEQLGLPSDIRTGEQYHFRSFPQIASALLREYADAYVVEQRAESEHYEYSYSAVDESNSRDDAASIFREKIAQICNLVPIDYYQAGLSDGLKGVRPSWVITTNYDLILEHLLSDATTVLPNQPLVPNTDNVPIYHLHGHHLEPSSIKITEEDYIWLLAPLDYQKMKLPLLLLESTTLMLGYALGDINVRAAMEWSKSFKGSDRLRLSCEQGIVIQALFKPEDPREEPYAGANGELVLEVPSLRSFLRQLAEKRTSMQEDRDRVREKFDRFLSNPDNAEQLPSDRRKRDQFLEMLKADMPLLRTTAIVEFLSQTLSLVWEKASQPNAFEFYNIYMSLVLDVLIATKSASCPPALFCFLADALDRVGFRIDADKGLGSAFAATDTWIMRRKEIAPRVMAELRSYASAYKKRGLRRAIGTFDVSLFSISTNDEEALPDTLLDI